MCADGVIVVTDVANIKDPLKWHSLLPIVGGVLRKKEVSGTRVARDAANKTPR